VIQRLVKQTPVIAKINVTPIIDVALVLVIILLITAPMMALADLDVELPPARTQALADDVRVNVTLGRDGRLAIDDEVVDRNAFAAALAVRLARNPEERCVVVLRADAGARHQDVRGLIQEARDVGAERIAIATRTENGAES
jgi:biopolymer transport protein ExbD